VVRTVVQVLQVHLEDPQGPLGPQVKWVLVVERLGPSGRAVLSERQGVQGLRGLLGTAFRGPRGSRAAWEAPELPVPRGTEWERCLFPWREPRVVRRAALPAAEQYGA